MSRNHSTKNSTPHPLAKYFKCNNSEKVKTYHNSINNPEYTAVKARGAAAADHRVAFTVIGNRLTRDFLDCCQWLNTLHTYRSKKFKTPVIRGLTELEWQIAWNDLKLTYGVEAFCISKPVTVLMNNEFLGDAEDLKKLLQSRYLYRFSINYRKRGIEEFEKYLKNSGRPCVYMHIAIDDQIIGSFVFMLYRDLVPLTCENFTRLCRERRGGYGGTPLHRVVRDGWVQGGGYGLRSVPLPCENYAVPHDRRGVLSMANDGRYCDNSTQFIITLQPTEWMNQKYVAFGQLIDGDETLKKVEAVPTRHESPLSKIIIRKAGELTLEWKTRPCPHTIQYLEKHILNVDELVNHIMNDIFETVNLELEYKLVVSRVEVKAEDHGANDDVRPANAVESSSKKSDETNIVKSSSTGSTDAAGGGGSEGWGGGRRSASCAPSDSSRAMRAPRVLYLSLTDVPYPGECDSDMDLAEIKLKCINPLFGNLSHRIPPAPTVSQNTVRESDSLAALSHVHKRSTDSSLCSDMDEDCGDYSRLNADRLSFAGCVISSIARQLTQNKFLASLLRAPDHVEGRKALNRTVAIADPTEGEGDAVEGEARRQAVRRRRRPTGYVRSKPVDESSDSESESHGDSDDGVISLSQLAKLQQHEQLKKSVRIASGSLLPRGSSKGGPLRRPTGYVRGTPTQLASATSLSRLLDASAPQGSHPDHGPRLKDYKHVLLKIEPTCGSETSSSTSCSSHARPLTSLAPKSFFLTSSANNRRSLMSEPLEERVLRGAAPPPPPSNRASESLDNILALRHGPRLMRRYSSDYVHTRFLIEKAKQRRLSIRTAEFAKKRPSLTVEQYKRKSLLLERDSDRVLGQIVENFANDNDPGLHSTAPNLHLKGDTPTYSWMDGVNFSGEH